MYINCLERFKVGDGDKNRIKFGFCWQREEILYRSERVELAEGGNTYRSCKTKIQGLPETETGRVFPVAK